jgi:hypothetical protein
MKNINKNQAITIILISLLTFLTQTNAQELGLRLENQNGGLDAMVPFEKSRLHIDVMAHSHLFAFEGITTDAIYDFIFKEIDNSGFFWYIGAGATAQFSSGSKLGASGEAGIEYRFADTPLVLGIDGRPTIWIVGSNNWENARFGFNIRWVL